MAARERMQLARRRDPYPWTWEPFVLWTLALLMVLLLGVHVGRGVANWSAGAEFTWPRSQDLAGSTFRVVGGDPTAGLAHPHRLARLARRGQLADSGALRGWLIGIEVIALSGYGVITVVLLRLWGPWRVLGMASREEAERLLGRRRLRKVAHVVRPDLFDNPRSGRADRPGHPWSPSRWRRRGRWDPVPDPGSDLVSRRGEAQYRDYSDAGTEAPLGRGLPTTLLPVRRTRWRARSRAGDGTEYVTGPVTGERGWPAGPGQTSPAGPPNPVSLTEQSRRWL